MKYLRTCFTCFLSLICLAVPSYAQVQDDGWFVTHYTTNEGLSNNNIKTATTDKNGFLWMATEYGLSRFDGRRFVNFTQDNMSVNKSNRWRGMYKDWEKQVYAVNDLWQVFEINEEAVPVLRDDLKVFKNCIINEYGQFVISKNSETEKIIRKIANIILSKSYITSVSYFVNDTSCYLMRDSSIEYYSPRCYKRMFLNFPVKDRVLARDAYIYVLMETDILKQYYMGVAQPGNIKAQYRDKLTGDEKNNMGSWLGYLYYDGDNLYCRNVDGKDATFSFVMKTDKHDKSQIVFDQHSSTCFIMSNSSGLYVLKKQLFKNHVLTLPSGRAHTYVLLEHNQELLCGEQYLNRTGCKPPEDKENAFVPIYKDGDSLVWTQCDKHLIHTQGDGSNLKKVAPLSWSVNDFYIGRYDKQLYCHTNTTLYRVENRNSLVPVIERKFEKWQILQPNINAVEQFFSPQVWLIGDCRHGLFMFDEHSGKLSEISQFRDISIRSITYDSLINAIWIGTYGRGLFVIDRDMNIKAMPSDMNGNISVAHYVLYDGLGYYWVPTNNGLFRISLVSVKGYINGSITAPEYQYFGSREGLTYTEFNGGFRNSGLRLKNGRLVFASMGGIIEVNPADFIMPAGKYRIFVDYVEVDGKRQLLNATLQDNFTDLRIDLSSPRFGQAQPVFEYCIPELNAAWISMRENYQLHLSALKPGNYTILFRIKDESDKSRYKAINIRVTGPWYRSTLAIVMYGVAGGALLFSFFAYRTNLRQKKTMKELQITQSELKALRSQINPHYFSNVLGSIQKYIYRNDAETAGEYLANFARLMRMSLDNSESDFIHLTDEVEYLKCYLELENRSARNPFKYEIDISAINGPENIMVPSMLIQPYLENAIRHGLSHSSIKSPALIIRYHLQKGRLQCEIYDNGVGLGGQLKGRRVSGSVISGKRLELFGKLTNKPVGIELLEVEEGTKIIITLPYQYYSETTKI